LAKKNHIEDIKRFASVLSENLFLKYGDNPSTMDILTHLSTQGLIPPIRLRNYLIICDFYTILRKNEGHVTHTFMDLSIEYELSERQIQTIVYEYQKQFQKDNILFR
jgi:hypothetical protein